MMGLNQNRLRIFVLLFLSFISACSFNAYGNKIYVLTQHATTPYFNYTNQHNTEGFMYDIFENLKGPDYVFEFIKDSINIDGADFIYGFITQNEVPPGYHFLELPHRIEYYVFTRKGANIISLNDLLNTKIIVLKNDLPYQLLYDNKASHILIVKSYKESLLMLAAGFNDCAIIPFQTGLQIIKDEKLKNIDYVITPFLSFNLGIAIPQNRTDIIEQFETGLQKSLKNNEYKIIEDKWISKGVRNGSELNAEVKLWVYGVVILVFVILLLIGIIRYLIAEINSSTKDYINEISTPNISPIIIDLNNPFVKQLLSFAPAWIFVNDINGNIHNISQDLLREAIHSEEKQSNLKVANLFSKEFVDVLTSLDYSLSTEGSNLINEPVQLEINGEILDRWLIKYPIRDQSSHQLLFLNLIVKPLTEGQYSSRLLTSEFALHAIIDALPDIIFIKNDKGVYLGGNKALFEFLGKTEDEIVGKSDVEIFGEEKALKYSESDKIIFEKGIICEGQEWDQSHTNKNVWLENVKIPLINEKNEIIALVGISHDVTRHHKYEIDLAAAKESAEESDRLKSSFLANMSHEIRTPMNSIIGFSDLLADPDLTIDQRIEIIDMIQSNGHTLIDLIDDIIDFSRIEAGQIHLKFSDFNLNTVLSDAYNYGISKRNQLNKEHLNITFDMGSLNDVYMIHSDPFRLRQVLKNLLNSAIRFSTSESIFLGYLIKATELILYIKNDNNVISEHTINKLIAHKSDFKYSVSDLEESTGIALIIAKNVIEMIGGQLYAEEIVSGRPDFYFAIPLKIVEQKEILKTQPQITDIPDWTNKTILIAEDEEINFVLLEGILAKTNVKIIRATNGIEATELYQQNASEIILTLMDIRMPELNGVDAARKILELYPEAIILAQTAYAMPEDNDQYIKVGMKAVMAKPIDPSQLYFMCNKYLSKK